MAAGLRQPAAGVQQTGARGQAVRQGQGVTDVRAAGVADGGEAAVQHLAQRPIGEGGQIFRAPAQQLQDVEVGGPDVHVGVDQPRHQGAPAEVDHLAGLGAANLTL